MFIIRENLDKLLSIALLSMLPTFEGRYALTMCYPMQVPLWLAYVIALFFSTLPLPFLLLLLKPAMKWFMTWPLKPVRAFATWFDRRSRAKAEKMSRKSLLGLFLFVAIPLPGTGIWTGAAIATILDMKRLPSALTIIAGNIVACLITALLTYGLIAIS